jgi:hypothetical protein
MIKEIKFYKYNISIDKDPNYDCLNDIENHNIEPTEINGEIIKIESFNIKKFSNRFFGININSGDLYHYSDSVVDTEDNLKLKKNPRKSTEIEFDNQFFFLIDTEYSNIYISNSQKKSFIESSLSKKTGFEFNIELILNEDLFKESLKTISEVNFAFYGSDLFSKGSLVEELDKDKHNYEADSVRIIFNYKHKKFTGSLKNKIEKLIKNKGSNKLKIVGKDSDDLETVFNADSILGSIPLKIKLEDKTKIVDYISVFNELIVKIKK